MFNRATSINIAAEIRTVCENVGIQSKQMVVMLRDAAATMNKASNILELESIDCFIHKIQLCVKDALTDFESTISSVRKVCAKYNTSSTFHREFEQLSGQSLIKVILNY